MKPPQKGRSRAKSQPSSPSSATRELDPRSNDQGEVEFKPTHAQQLYLLKEQQYLATRRHYTQRQIAKELDLAEETVSRWHQQPGYDAWANKELAGLAKRLLARGIAAAAAKTATSPDARDIEILARVLAGVDAKHPTADGAAADGSPELYQIITLIPRPGMDPERWAGEPLRVPDSASR